MADEDEVLELGPQEGPQTLALSTPADILIFGGGVGGGKSFALLLEPLRHIHNARFNAVMFRRQAKDLRGGVGLWDESQLVYRSLGARGFESRLEWRFPSGATIKMDHLEHESDKFNHQGKAYALAAWDELTQFTETMFWFLFGRLRSVSGVRPYVRATCNPDPDSWVKRFIRWWLDDDGAYPIPERCGKLRWFIRDGDELVWADSPAELFEERRELFVCPACAGELADHPAETDEERAEREAYNASLKEGARARAEPTAPRWRCEACDQVGQVRDQVVSVTFIPSKLEDNPALTKKDPSYRSRVAAEGAVAKERKLGGNWAVREKAGDYFLRSFFKLEDVPLPAEALRVRFWDLASGDTSKNDWTVGLLLAWLDGLYRIEDVVRVRARPHEAEEAIRAAAELDGKMVPIWFEQEVGAAAHYAIHGFETRVLPGYMVHASPVRDKGSKRARARLPSSAAQRGLISVVDAPWTNGLMSRLEAYPTKGVNDDEVDALSGAFDHVLDDPLYFRVAGR